MFSYFNKKVLANSLKSPQKNVGIIIIMNDQYMVHFPACFKGNNIYSSCSMTASMVTEKLGFPLHFLAVPNETISFLEQCNNPKCYHLADPHPQAVILSPKFTNYHRDDRYTSAVSDLLQFHF